MPYVTKDFYFEHDFRDLDIEQLNYIVSQFRYAIRSENNGSFFEGFTPSPEAALKDFEEFDSLVIQIRYAARINKSAKEASKRCTTLRKAICDTLLQWGEQALNKHDKSHPFSWHFVGFPTVSLYSIRRPTSVPYIECEVDKKTKGKVSLTCRNGAKLLSFFHWEISENGGVTWKQIRKTKYPKCQVTKLEPWQSYCFRCYISNPKGRSPYSNSREVKIPGPVGKPAGALKKYPANGALGALLDEYRRAVSELKELIRLLKSMHLTDRIDTTTKDENCRSIQTILAHVVSSGHNYMVAIRRKMGEDFIYFDKELLDTPDKYRLALNGMFNFAVQLFEDYPDLALEELDNQHKIKVRWGQLYDVEQLMEHAIVHVLRHRRQVERFLGKMAY